MSFKKLIISAAIAAASLGLGGCATGLPTQVSRFQAMPAAGQSFVIRAEEREKNGGLEFAQYANLVREHLSALGYRPAQSDADATLVVSLDYGVDQGRERVVATRDPFMDPWGYRGFGYRPYYSRFGYGGFGRYRSPFFWGWHDPFWGGYDVDSYTLYTSYLEIDIRRPDGQSVFEGKAQARSRSDELPRLVPNLVEALFTGFPGNNGETLRITVMPEREGQGRN